MGLRVGRMTVRFGLVDDAHQTAQIDLGRPRASQERLQRLTFSACGYSGGPASCGAKDSVGRTTLVRFASITGDNMPARFLSCYFSSSV